MAKVIAFTGSCHSGKTTMIEDLKKRFDGRITVCDECIRHKVIKSIDDMRSDPEAYIDFQIKVITEKYESERRFIVEHPNSVILTDRSLADSLFYLIFYVDKSKLSRKTLSKYLEFVNWVYFRAATSGYRYDHIMIFKPIKKTCFDPYRPANLDIVQDTEFLLIRTLVMGLYGQSTKMTEISAESEIDTNIVHGIIEAYTLHERPGI